MVWEKKERATGLEGSTGSEESLMGIRGREPEDRALFKYKVS